MGGAAGNSPWGRRVRRARPAVAAVLFALLAAACAGPRPAALPPPAPPPASASASSATISETGSTLLLPLVSAWQVAYGQRHAGVLITSSGTGSGTGIADAAAGTVTIGGSDAYLSPANRSQHPGLLNIPLAVAAIDVNYNLPGVQEPLNLNGTVLARIYAGTIRTWDDPAIAALNRGVPLPGTKIVTLHRADSSGSTFLFSSYLNTQDPGGWPAARVGTSISWPPLPGATAETGSGAMVKGCVAIKGCIAYIGISYQPQAASAGLGTASLANKGGQFEQPSTATINAALATFSGSTPADGSQSLINGGAGYPIINYEYAIVRSRQASPAGAAAVRAFLGWGITSGTGPRFLTLVSFVPLPPSVRSIARALIARIS